jgi:hypothetical protein
MACRSTRETLEDLRLLLLKFERRDPTHDDVSLTALKRILRDRILQLETSVGLLSTADVMHDMTTKSEKV